MAMAASDPRSGFNSASRTFHSLRPASPLPPPSLNPLSLTSFAFSLLPSPLPSKPALISSSSSDAISFADLISSVAALSSSLSSSSYLSSDAPGHVALILSPPSLHIPVLYFSLLSLGVVVSPSNPLSSPSEISRQFHLVNPTIVFATSSTASKLPPAAQLPVVLLDSPHFLSLLSTPPKARNFGHSTNVQQSDPAAIAFSSGTTGKVKGVVLTHRNLIAAVTMLLLAASPGGGGVMMLTVPLFHVFGLIYSMAGLALGQTVVIQTERYDVGRMMGAVERLGVTNLVVAPPALLGMVRFWEEGEAKVDLKSLARVSCGGGAIGVGLIRRFINMFPNVSLVQGYGMTESTAGVFRAVGTEEIQFGSCGRLAPYCEAMVVDPFTGSALHPCEEGEIWLKGPVIMKGYIGDKEATSSTLNSEGWLKTGDLGYINNDGFLFIVDRLKELIKYKGYQVPPAELEDLLQTHNDVVEAAVVPYPDDEAGQIPMAFIVRLPNSTLHETEIMEFVAKQVAPHKKIRRVAFVNSIPKTPTGKILRKDLLQLVTRGVNPKL